MKIKGRVTQTARIQNGIRIVRPPSEQIQVPERNRSARTGMFIAALAPPKVFEVRRIDMSVVLVPLGFPGHMSVLRTFDFRGSGSL